MSAFDGTSDTMSEVWPGRNWLNATSLSVTVTGCVFGLDIHAKLIIRALPSMYAT